MTQPSTALTEQDRSILRSAEVALQRGMEQWAWWLEQEASNRVKLFPLLPPTTMFQSVGMFENFTLQGKKTSVMGCLQTGKFSTSGSAGSAFGETMGGFALEKLPGAFHFTHSDGLPGGFKYQPMLAKLKGKQEHISFGDQTNGNVPLEQIGTSYEWVVYRIDLYDFGRSVPALSGVPQLAGRLLREALYAVVHEKFIARESHPAPGVAERFEFGYSVLPYVVIPNIFGYGPGHFGTAVQYFRFKLMENGDIEAKMDFISSPRSEKVLDLWGFDPVYTVVNLLDTVAFRGGKFRDSAHEALDKEMLSQHVRVHEHVLLGTRKIWETQNWAAASRRTNG